jgi:alpha-L-rhamnosidase
MTRTANDTSPTNIVLDYGIDVGGLPAIDVTAASGSPQLRASYSESLSYLTVNGDHAPSHSADPQRYDSYTVNEPGTITNAYVQGGERYQMISLTTPGTVALSAVGVKIGFYRAGADGYHGHFVCSDEDLNKIWYASAYTLQTNMLPPGSIAAPKISGHNNAKTPGGNAVVLTSTDAHNAPLRATPAPPRSFDLLPSNRIPVVVDGAKRDRSVWSGDLAVQGPVIYYSTGATGYMRESLRLLGSYGAPDGRVSTNLPGEWPVGTGPTADSETRIYSANYTLWWARALADYYLYTGDKEFLKEEWPILTRELDWSASQVASDGLFVTNQKNGRDWDYYDGPKVGAVTAYNALYYRVLIDSAGLADDLGQDIQARKYRAEAAALKQAINARLFNSQTGLFDTSDIERGGIAQDANVFATAFGLVPEDKAESILARLKESLWTKCGPKPFSDAKYKPYISPYVTGFELLARLRANDGENAIHLMSSLWGTMIAPGDFQSGAVWENMTLDGKPGLGSSTSLAHGWAAMPAVALSSLVLGIQPESAGYATWRIQPHPGDLQWAEGRAPTPKGPIDVAWGRAQTASQFGMRVSTPAGTSGEIAVPAFGARVAVFVNGRMVWNGEKANDYAARGDSNYIYLDHLPGGTYEIFTRSGD